MRLDATLPISCCSLRVISSCSRSSYPASFSRILASLYASASFSSFICYFVLLLLLLVWSKLAETPLLAELIRNSNKKCYYDVLTTHSCGLAKDLSHLRIHLDHYVFLDTDLIVSGFHLVLDPLRELFLENGGTNIGDPLLRSFGKLK